MQNHYNLVYREEEREMIPLCVDEGIGLIPWSPLARGFLAGNRARKDFGETSRAKTDGYAHELYYDDSDFSATVLPILLLRGRFRQNPQLQAAAMYCLPRLTAHHQKCIL